MAKRDKKTHQKEVDQIEDKIEEITVGIETDAVPVTKLKLTRPLVITLFFLGALVVLLLNFSQIIKSPQSTIKIEPQDDRFKILFDFKNQELEVFNKFLGNLNAGAISTKVDFELDSTSSTRLAFLTPIVADLNVSEKKVTFDGELQTSLILPSARVEDLHMGDTYRIAIYGKNLDQLIKPKYKITSELESWFNQSFMSYEPMYLISLQENSFAIFFKNSNLSFEPIKNIKLEGEVESIYKEEALDDNIFYLIRLNSDIDTLFSSVVITKFKEWYLLSESKDTAKSILDTQTKSTRSFRDFATDATFILSLNNPETVTESLIDFVLVTQSSFETKLLEAVNKTKSAELVLKQSTFSGLITLK